MRVASGCSVFSAVLSPVFPTLAMRSYGAIRPSSACRKFFGLVALLGAWLITGMGPAFAQTSTPTTTTLTISSGGNPVLTISSNTTVSLTATVEAGSTPVTPGQVNFCDATAIYCSGAHLVGTAQLTSLGTAVLRFRPAAGTHLYKAVFLGTNSFSASASTNSSLSVTGAIVSVATSTAISKTGSWGNYALVATVSEAGSTDPISGTVSFADTTYGDAVLGSAPLATSTPGWAWINAQTFQTGTTPFSIVNADFNGDGIPDLAVANARSNTVTILLGKGDGTFTTSSNIPFSSEPYPLMTADFNSDGNPDLGVVNYVQNTITILLGKGDGTFTTVSQTPSIGGILEGLTIGDFNNDGIPDIVTSTYIGPTTVFLGNGDGTFRANSISATLLNWLTNLVAGDFNGDGKLDFAGTDGSIIRIFPGNGDGTFTQSATTYNFGGALATSDFDNDGKPDLMVTDGSGSAIFLHGNGDGTFTAGTPTPATVAYRIETGDFNGDGLIDAALLNPSNSTVTFLFGNGDGTFTPQSPAPTGNDPTYITAGDFNGDGRADVATANSADNTVLLTEPTQAASTSEVPVAPAQPGQHQVVASYAGNGNFGASSSAATMLWGQPPVTNTTLNVTAAGAAATTVASGTVVTLTATVNAGGTPLTSGEVDYCDSSSPNCTGLSLIGRAWLTASGTAVFQYRPGPGQHNLKAVFQENAAGLSSSSVAVALMVTPPAHVTAPTTTTIAEAGSVGNYSLTATVVETGSTAPLSGTVSFLDTSYSDAVLGSANISSSTPGLAWQNSFAVTQTQTPKEVAVNADFNGDGIPDIVAANFNSAALTVLLGKGDGTFTAAASPIASSTQNQYPYWMAVGDFNGDGKRDIAVLSIALGGYGGNLAILLGNGDGTFTVSAGPAMSQNPMGLVAADFNGDGELDLVIGDSSRPATVLLGNGDGTFTPESTSGISTTTPQSMATGDLNDDGLPDLTIVANQAVKVYLSNGDGSFRIGPALSVVDSNPYSVALGDLNGDGIADLVIGDTSGMLSVLLGKGDATFTPVEATANAGSMSPAGMAIGDFNNDGKADLAVAAFYNNAILLGNGDGTFAVSTVAPVTDVAFSIALADFNGDGTQDIAVGNRSGVTAFLTQATQTTTFTANGISPSGPAPHLVEASYGGDSNYEASKSSPVSLNVQVATPVITPASGSYTSAQTFTVTDATPGATIYYEASGTVQTNGWIQYTGPITLGTDGGVYFSVYASAAGYQQSQSVSTNYILNLPPAPTPVISVASGTYPGPQTVTISDSASSAPIYYTINGTYPTIQSALYTGPITVASSETIVAFASGGGYKASGYTSAQYIIASAASPFIYTIAGNGTYGDSGDGGLATFATLNYSGGIAVDSAGNEFIADTSNNMVRRIDAASGTITTVAGNGIAGYSGDNGPATAAELLYPSAVAVDSAGNLYIADSQNNVVRKVAASTGIITTVAGTGPDSPSSGITGDNGPATSASLQWPNGVAVDKTGNLYIADTLHCAIREVNASSGSITTIAGNGTCGYSGDNGPASAASFSHPTGIALDAGGNLYIADSQNNVVRKVSAATGVITTVAGMPYAYGGVTYSGDGGPAADARLFYPDAVSLDGSGNLFIADKDNSAVREVNASTGIITTLAGGTCVTLSGDGGPAGSAGLCYPMGVAANAEGNVLIADSYHQRVRLVTAPSLPPSGTTAVPVFSLAAGTYSGPQILTITDPTPGAEIYLTLDGSTPTTLGLSYRGPLNINGSITVRAIAVAPGYLPSAPVSANYTISTTPPAVVNTIAGTGTLGFSGSGGPALSAQLSWPTGEAIDPNGNVYVADYYNCVVWELSSSTGNISVVAGTGQCGSSGIGGPATSAELFEPSHVAVDSGNLYISDTGNNRIVKVTGSTGIMTLCAGNGFGPGYPSGDGGPATSAAIYDPQGIALDAGGNLYIAEPWDGKVRMVSATTGTILTAAGGGSAVLASGQAPTAVKLDPVDVALDSAGDLYIAEYSRVSKVSAATGLISVIAGNGDRGTSGDGLPPLEAEIDVQSIALDGAANVYIAGPGGTVRMIPADGSPIATVAGNGYGTRGAEGISASLSGLASPAGLAFDSAGALYIAESLNHRVRRVTFPGLTIDPVFSLAPGAYSTSQILTITDSTSRATIYYTINGQTPTTASTVYAGPIPISSTETVKAIAVASGMASSGIVSADYQIGPPVAPVITWPAPGPITYGTALSSTQLDATAPVLGTFTYNPPAGTLLSAGNTILTATFTPANTQRYTTSTASVSVTVNQVVPQIIWGGPAPIVYGTALSATQLNATATVPGSFTYSPAAGTILQAGNQVLTVNFTPSDSTNYSTASATVTLSVINPAPTISGFSPAYTAAGGPGFSLTVNGGGFVPGSTVFWGTTALSTQYVGLTQLTAQVPASAIATSGTASVTVQTNAPGGGSSSSLLFEIDSPTSAGGSAPVFSTSTASVQPGSSFTYPVTLPSSVVSATAACLNLPAGVNCSYSNGTLTVATSATSPLGTYQITVVFTETVNGAAPAAILLPLFLLPLTLSRRKQRATRMVQLTLLAALLLACALLPVGCGGGGSAGSGSNPPPAMHQATSSGIVTLTIK